MACCLINKTNFRSPLEISSYLLCVVNDFGFGSTDMVGTLDLDQPTGRDYIHSINHS